MPVHKFNSQVITQHKSYFTSLGSPVAASAKHPDSENPQHQSHMFGKKNGNRPFDHTQNHQKRISPKKLSSSIFRIMKSQLLIQIQHNFLTELAYLKFVKTILRSAILRSPSTEHVKNGVPSSHQQLNHNRTCDTTLYHFVWNFMGHAIRELYPNFSSLLQLVYSKNSHFDKTVYQTYGTRRYISDNPYSIRYIGWFPRRKFHLKNLVSEFSLRKFQIGNLVSEIFIRNSRSVKTAS